MTRSRRHRRRPPQRENASGLEIKATLEGTLGEYNLIEKVEEEMDQRGIPTPPRPKLSGGDYFDGEIPSDLSNVGDEELGDLLSLTSRWYGYVSGQLGKAQVEEVIMTAQIKAVEAFLRQRLEEERQREQGSEDGKPEVGKKYLDDDAVRTNPVYIRVNALKMKVDGVVKMLKRAEEAAENNRRAVSNEVRNRENRGRNAGREQTVHGARRSKMARGRKKE